MHYTTNRIFSEHRRIYRSKKDRVFAGVCGGLGEHFGVSTTWLRVGFIIGSLLTSFVVPALYILCIILMPQEGTPVPVHRRRKAKPVEMPKFRNREEAINHLSDQFERIEAKIRKMEDYVTSKEYVLKRKFEDL